LTHQEARRRLSEQGPNALPQAPPVPLWRRVLGQLRSALIYVLLFALAVDLGIWLHAGAVGFPVEPIAIGAILILNTVLGVWQEYRAEDALEKLRELEAPQVPTLRDGHLVPVASRELVVGDVVRIAAGGRVPADARVDGEGGLLVDESILTDESVPVEKEPGGEVFAGTLVVRGTGYAEITRTGAASAMGRIAVLLGRVRSDPTPLERRLAHFGNRIALRARPRGGARPARAAPRLPAPEHARLRQRVEVHARHGRGGWPAAQLPEGRPRGAARAQRAPGGGAAELGRAGRRTRSETSRAGTSTRTSRSSSTSCSRRTSRS
jgi:Ca2+-transporting ATPase